VLRSDDIVDAQVSNDIERELTKQLRENGFDAFDAQVTLKDLMRDQQSAADLYVLVGGAEMADRNIGAIGVNTIGLGTTLGVTLSRIATEVRVYDGKTLEVLDRYELMRDTKSFGPTSIGLGDRNVFVAIATPFVHHAQYRSAIRSVAAEAAKRLADR